MKEVYGNMLEMDGDAIVVTTNGYYTLRKKAVMGRGIALQISRLIPTLEWDLGHKLYMEGNHVYNLFQVDNMSIVSFPVKPNHVINDGTNVVSHCKTKIGEYTVGFLAKADVNLIEQSLKELVQLTNENKWNRVLIPRVGCGAGELDYKDIKPLMEKYLDDRFICCTFK